MADTSTYCLDLLRESGGNLYSALLFLPDDVREDVAAIHAFHLEIGRIAYLVSEPMPGEIRLQWWRDVLAPEDGVSRAGEADANPLARAVVNAMERHNLPKDGFHRYLDARVFDLYNDPMPDRETLEAYLGETDSFIFQLVAMIIGAESSSDLADACGHGGVASGIARCLVMLAQDRSLQKTYVPKDLLAAAGLSHEEWLAKPDKQHEMAVTAYHALGSEHLDKAFAAVKKLPKSHRAGCMPLVLTRGVLKAASNPASVLDGLVRPSPLRQQAGLWKAALFGI